MVKNILCLKGYLAVVQMNEKLEEEHKIGYKKMSEMAFKTVFIKTFKKAFLIAFTTAFTTAFITAFIKAFRTLNMASKYNNL